MEYKGNNTLLINQQMRYNSLRSQLNWHSRQQTHIFKKISKNTIDKEQTVQQQNKLEQDHHLKGHQLIWLQKMMKELHHYKEEALDKQGRNRKAKEESTSAILKEKCVNINRQSKVVVDKDKKVAVNLDENGKSAKKIKFQIVINQDKCQSIKKVCLSQQKPKNKSSKKIPSKTVPKKMITEKTSSANKPNSSKELLKQVNNSCPSNTKVIEIQEIKTDPYSFKQADIQILEQLWKKQSEQSNEPQPKLSSKKSIGKIIKNSELNKTCIQMNKQTKPANESSNPHGISCNTVNSSGHQNSSYKQYKQTKHKQSTSIHSFESKELTPLEVKQAVSNQFKTHPSVQKSKDIKIIQKPQDIKIPQHKIKYQKIYIKLQTQKLSEYLSEKSQVKIHQEPNEKIIQTNEYQKYCITKRAQKPLVQLQERNLTSQNKLNEYFNEGKNKQQNAPRTKSEQRKLNRLAHNIRPTKLFDLQTNTKQHKQPEKTIEQSTLFAPRASILDNKQSDSRIQIKLKRKYQYQQEEPQSRAQKLFTLHSVSSDYSSKQEQKQQQVQNYNYEKQQQQQIRPSLSIQFQQQLIPNCKDLPQSNQYCQTNPSNKSNNQPSQNHLSESLFKQSIIAKDLQVSKSDFTQQLTVLFNFLDQGHRGLLTDTNCLYQSLTQELKLLFSVILNQIRTKKRFYNLQKFIQQSKEILQIKNEVYNNNNKASQNQNMVYQILRQNLDILKKKLPLMFVKCIYTQSYFDNSNLQSRRNSVSYGQSFVVDKIEIDRNTTKRQLQDGMNSNKSHATPSVNKDTNSYSSKNSEFDIKWTEKRQKDKQNQQRYDQPFKEYNYKKVEQSQSQLDVLQPQIYLQKKYGFTGKDQEQTGQSTSKINSIFLKTRGYLQNLDNYIKMR